ncbi:hypothetical protein NG895_15310 [Aeoliella sp. ICT_H6.2]|uniref:Cytochrome c domain-containing protein n=1 Tax=Aeoliella straminimaris TaxID=2954799 RepID=A0A9X2FB37_9BACT|nr:cytochrome c peroxidase [Aeoliella straminimaris]MCO6045279.1 hypothetical protein [Aeoliella straminimaris]
MRACMGRIALGMLCNFSLAISCARQATATQPVELTPLEELGEQLFFDEISHPSGMSCASCHAPSTGWSGPTSEINAHGAVYPAGTTPARFGNRRPPSAAYVAQSPVFHWDQQRGSFVGGNFWDGRATGEKLGNPAADQALGPFLNPVEMNNAYKATVLAEVAASPYADLWQQVWGEPLEYDTSEKIETNYDRIGTAIGAYEASEKVNPFTSKFDYARKGMVELTAQEDRGLKIFNGKGKCSNCHTSDSGSNGEPPLFTDFSYENLGVPKNPENPFYDMDEVTLDDGTPINPEGDAWIDSGLGGFLATRAEWADEAADNMGKHKTPTVRNVAMVPYEGFTRAYMHNGVFKSLEEVVSFYATRDDGTWPDPEVADNMNTNWVGNLNLSASDQAALVAFMEALTDGYAILPGDFNGDDVVNIADYTLWRNNLGAPPGTLLNDPDNVVIGAAQYATWKANFGNTLPTPGAQSTATIPEPTSAAILAAGMVALWMTRRVFR